MPTTIYARFSDVDQAEAAIRTLRHHCGGIRAFQIRRRPRIEETGSDVLPTAAFALYGSGAFEDNAMNMNSVPAAASIWETDRLSHLPEGGTDGPAGREDCLLSVTVEDAGASRASSLLRAAHGLEIFESAPQR